MSTIDTIAVIRQDPFIDKNSGLPEQFDTMGFEYSESNGDSSAVVRSSRYSAGGGDRVRLSMVHGLVDGGVDCGVGCHRFL